MEREKISQEIANQYVLDVLESYIDISEDANILTSIMNNEATYELNDTKMVKDTPTKRVIPLKTKEYFAFYYIIVRPRPRLCNFFRGKPTCHFCKDIRA